MTAKKRYVYVVGYAYRKEKPSDYKAAYGYFPTPNSAIKEINAYLKKHPKLKWYGHPMRETLWGIELLPKKEHDKFWANAEGFFIARCLMGEVKRYGKCPMKDFLPDPRYGFIWPLTKKKTERVRQTAREIAMTRLVATSGAKGAKILQTIKPCGRVSDFELQLLAKKGQRKKPNVA